MIINSEMKRFFIHIVFLLSSLCMLNTAAMASTFIEVDTHQENIFIIQTELKQYYESGRYEHDIEETMVLAKEKLDALLKQDLARKKPAIVFDIDETVLSNWTYIKNFHFGFEQKTWDAWQDEAAALAIQPVLDFYYYAQSKQVTVFFITGRMEDSRHATERNLEKAGYRNYADIYLNSAKVKNNVADFKTRAREKIEAMGYTILLDIGDQYSDLCGDHTAERVKIPNPFYFIPGCPS